MVWFLLVPHRVVLQVWPQLEQFLHTCSQMADLKTHCLQSLPAEEYGLIFFFFSLDEADIFFKNYFKILSLTTWATGNKVVSVHTGLWKMGF